MNSFFIDLSTDSEDETPPDRKRPRLEPTAQAMPNLKGISAKLVPLPKAAVTKAMSWGTPRSPVPTTVGQPSIKSMNIPSGITVTKHNNISNGNSVISNKQVKVAAAQKIAWSMSNKTLPATPTTTTTMAKTMHSQALKVTPVSLPTLQKPPLQQLPPSNNSRSTPPQLTKFMPAKPTAPTAAPRPMPTLTASTAARVVPFKVATAAITSSLHSMAASATPPLRLLATPPHCAAALNEPLLLNLPATTSITPQLTPTTTPPPASAVQQLKITTTLPGASISPVPKAPKRVQPITVLKKSDEVWRKHLAQQKQQQQQSQQPKPSKVEEPMPTIVLVESPPTTPPTDKAETESCKAMVKPKSKTTAPLVPEYAALLQLSRQVDQSKDMERLIEVKLLKYYHSVHENFVRSRGFRKLLELAMERIKAEPEMVYIHLKSVVDELKVRRKAKAVTAAAEEPEEQQPQQEQAKVTATTTPPATTPIVSEAPAPASAAPGTCSKRFDERIRKLNRTLYTITKRINALEQAEVNWHDDDDSSYLQVERYKKRACQIYEKICDLTGESKSAHRQLKQPIQFKDTPYLPFNRTLTAFVNRTHEFPDYHDVLQLLEHCNAKQNFGLATFEMKRIAHDAFVKVGKLLQARRRTDLYETVTHFTANAKDPAVSDQELLAKLNENTKKHKKISDIIAKYAREQDLTAEEQREARLKEKLQQQQVQQQVASNDDVPCTSAQAAQLSATTNGLSNADDDDEDSETDEEMDDDIDAFVDNFKTNGDVSDAESEAPADEMTPKNIVEETVATTTTTTTTATAAAAPVISTVEMRAKTADLAKHADNALPNGKVKPLVTPNMLKIMSVSSLNATISSNGQQQQQQQQATRTITHTAHTIATEIIISDEES